MKRRLGITPITSEIVYNNDDYERRFNIQSQEIELAYEMMYDDDYDMGESNEYIELVKYNVSKRIEPYLIRKLKSLPYVCGIVTNYIPNAIHCYVKC